MVVCTYTHTWTLWGLLPVFDHMVFSHTHTAPPPTYPSIHGGGAGTRSMQRLLQNFYVWHVLALRSRTRSLLKCSRLCQRSVVPNVANSVGVSPSPRCTTTCVREPSCAFSPLMASATKFILQQFIIAGCGVQKIHIITMYQNRAQVQLILHHTTLQSIFAGCGVSRFTTTR